MVVERTHSPLVWDGAPSSVKDGDMYLAFVQDGRVTLTRCQQVLEVLPPSGVYRLAGGGAYDAGGNLATHPSGAQTRLTRKESQLIRRFIAAPNRVLTSEQILTSVWGPGYEDDLNYLRVWVSRLRKCVGAKAIECNYGVGYELKVERIDPEATV